MRAENSLFINLYVFIYMQITAETLSSVDKKRQIIDWNLLILQDYYLFFLDAVQFYDTSFHVSNQ